jgi:hypothetical protein
MGCVMPVVIIACLTGISIWYINYVATNGFFGNPPTPVPTIVLTSTPEAEEIGAPCICTRNTYDCADFTTQLEAQACYDLCSVDAGDIHYLDSNDNGLACESLP